MKIVKPDTLALLHGTLADVESTEGGGRECRLVLACLASFPFAPHIRELLPETELWACAKANLPPGMPLDEARPKPRAEFLVHGSCFAEPRSPGATRAREVTVTVGGMRKQLTVFGERHWKRTVHSDPAPFTRIPMTWENAFGGEGCAENPLGKGFTPLEDGKRPLPNVELHDEYICYPHDKPRPAGFGVLAPSWPPRREHAGTLDRSWFENHWPGHPDDMEAEFYMRAPGDQRMVDFFSGGEIFSIRGMHPEKEMVWGVLPAVRCRVFLMRRGQGKDAPPFQELEAKPDTLTLFPDHELGALTFRAVTHTVDEECADIAGLLTLFEPLAAAPEPAEHYRALLEEALKPPQPVAAPEVAEPSLGESLAREAAPLAQSVEQDAAKAAPSPKVAALEKAVARIEAETREILAKADLDEEGVQRYTAALERENKEFFQDEPGAVADEGLDAATRFQRLADELEAEAREMLRQSGKSEEEVEASLREAGKVEEPPDLAKHFAPQLEDPEVPEEVKAHLRDMIGAFAEAATLCASLEDVLRQAGKKKTPPEEPAAPASESGLEPDPEPEALSVEQVLEWHAKGLSLAETDLRGLDLSGRDLQGADFRNALLQGASFKLGNLSGADLRGADCSQANFTGCDLQGADLSGALLEKANLRKVKAGGSTARGARFQEADASGGDFGGADLEEADFSRARLDAADFRQARAPRIRFYGVSLKQADFSDANLFNSRANAETDASEAVFRRTDMTGSGWRGARLSRADMTGAKLGNADLSLCVLHSTRLERAGARYAKFFKADLENARLTAADLSGSSLRRARLVGTSCAMADLRGADLYQCSLGDTNLDGADMRQTILDPFILSAFNA